MSDVKYDVDDAARNNIISISERDIILKAFREGQITEEQVRALLIKANLRALDRLK